MSKTIKSFFCGLIFSTVLGGTLLTANALSSSKSNIMRQSANGVSYEAYSTVTTGKNIYGNYYVTGYTNVEATNVSTLRSGSCGVQPRFYSDDHSIIKSGDWTYSSGNATGVGSTVMWIDADSSKAYYAQGSFKIFNGNGYDEYDTWRSPSLRDFT